MSDSLFGGETGYASIQSKLNEVLKTVEGLTNTVRARNPSMADAIVMQGECPSGLVGCHPAKIDEASGGLLHCPTAEHLPDPIIVDSVGRFCYAPKAVKEVLDGKDLNIQSLQRKYSEKILDMLRDGNNLSLAVQSLTTTAPSSSYIINIFTNNRFVRNLAQDDDIMTQKLAAILTRYSNSLNPYTGGTFLSRILQEAPITSAAPPTGFFDSPTNRLRTTTASASSAPAFPDRSTGERERGGPFRARSAGSQAIPEAAADRPAANPFGAAAANLGGGAVHLSIAAALVSLMVLTASDSSKKAEVVKLIDAFGMVFDFDGKSLGVLPPLGTTSVDIAQTALEFVPIPLRSDLKTIATGLQGTDARIMMEAFVLLSVQMVVYEMYSSKPSKYVPALLVLQNAYKTMRDKEVLAQDLQTKKGRGDEVSVKEVDEIVRVQMNARKEYVEAARKFSAVMTLIRSYPRITIPTSGALLNFDSQQAIQSIANADFLTPTLDRFIINLPITDGDGDQDEVGDVTLERADFGIPDKTQAIPQAKVQEAEARAVAASRANFGGGELDDAFYGLVGGAAPQHFSPKEILEIGKDREGIIDKELQKKFKSLGYGEIPVFYSKKCPVYASENNSLGPNKTWIATKHPWSKCQELLGYQMVSEEGYCYPQGAVCYPEDDVVTVTKKTVQAVDAWLSTAKLYNSIMKKKYDTFLAAEIARLVASPETANMTSKEIQDLAISHMPVELQPLSEYAAVSSLVLTSNAFNEAVSQITKSSDAAQREEIRKILFETAALSAEWASEDAMVQNRELDRTSTRLFNNAKDCTEASLKVQQNTSKELIPRAMALEAANNGCDVVKIGASADDVLLIPTEINSRFDKVKAEKGEKEYDPVVVWWRNYYGAKAHDQAQKLRNVAQSISPFEEHVKKPVLAQAKMARPPTAQENLDKVLNFALDD